MGVVVEVVVVGRGEGLCELGASPWDWSGGRRGREMGGRWLGGGGGGGAERVVRGG